MIGVLFATEKEAAPFKASGFQDGVTIKVAEEMGLEARASRRKNSWLRERQRLSMPVCVADCITAWSAERSIAFQRSLPKSLRPLLMWVSGWGLKLVSVETPSMKLIANANSRGSMIW